MFSALGRYWWEGKRRKGRHLLSIKKKKIKNCSHLLNFGKIKANNFFSYSFSCLVTFQLSGWKCKLQISGKLAEGAWGSAEGGDAGRAELGRRSRGAAAGESSSGHNSDSGVGSQG